MPLVITCSAPFHVEIFPRRPDRGAVFSYILEGYLGSVCRRVILTRRNTIPEDRPRHSVMNVCFYSPAFPALPVRCGISFETIC